MDIITFGTKVPGAKRALYRRLPEGGGGVVVFPDYVAVYENGAVNIRSLDEVIGATEEWSYEDSAIFRLELTRMGVVTQPFVPKDEDGLLAAVDESLEEVEVPEDDEPEEKPAPKPAKAPAKARASKTGYSTSPSETAFEQS